MTLEQLERRLEIAQKACKTHMRRCLNESHCDVCSILVKYMAHIQRRVDQEEDRLDALHPKSIT